MRASAGGYDQTWYPDVVCRDCPAAQGTLIVPAPEEIITHEFRLKRR